MDIKEHIIQLIEQALDEARCSNLLPVTSVDSIPVERPQNPNHGDFSCSLPLKLARPLGRNPLSIAEILTSLIPQDHTIQRMWTAPPGFINFTLSSAWLTEQVDLIRGAGFSYGASSIGSGQRIQVEFVSVNPTGPIHVGHARGAVFGSALSEILKAAGFEVQKEYYFNDAGTQMDRFKQSLFARYLQVSGKQAELPEDGYQGEYMVELAQEIKTAYGDKFMQMPKDQAIVELGHLGLTYMVDTAKTDMKDLRVEYDNWFTENSLYSGGQFDRAMTLLQDGGYLNQREGATWFMSTALGDENDKVFVRSTGAPTYFATDVAYHYNKFFERHFDKVIDILGADHQGHVPFMKVVPKALGIHPERLELKIYQLVTLKRGELTVRVSKRSGELITLRELVDEVGADACRYFFLSRSPESQMEFDLELAVKQSNDNPVYYIQYAHARISGILRLAKERGIDHTDGDLNLLCHQVEINLVKKMLELPELIETMARKLEPHHLPHYAVEVATAFHLFYDQCRVVSNTPEDAQITKARIKLVEAARFVLARCLKLMIMETPEQM